MEKKKFWEIVESLNWKEASEIEKLAIDSVKLNLLVTLSPNEVVGFGNYFSEVYRLVEKHVDTALDDCDAYVSDDSFSDLISHIIGLGEDFMNKAFDDYQVIRDLADSGDYVESFSYLIPSIEDYEKLNKGHYAELARKYAQETKNLSEAEKLGDQITVDKFLDKVSNYDFKDILPLAVRVYEYWYSEEGKKANLDVHNRYNGYGVPNLASDIIIILPIIEKLNGGK